MILSVTFDRLADEAVRITPQHLCELSPLSRHATLAAAVIPLEESLTDAALTMFDKLLGSMARRAENRTRDKAIRTVREMQGYGAPATGPRGGSPASGADRAQGLAHGVQTGVLRDGQEGMGQGYRWAVAAGAAA